MPRYGRPLRLELRYWKLIEIEIQSLFNDIIFNPLFTDIKQANSQVTNAKVTALAEAIANGTVWFENGKFHGTFNARISKELQAMGAKFHGRSETWSYKGIFPPELSLATATASLRYTTLRKAVLQTLDNMNIASIDALSDIPDKYVRVIKWMNDDFNKAVEGITIVPQLTESQLGTLAAEWGMNLDLYVRKFVEEEIFKLRDIVQTEAFTGRRAESIAQLVQKEFGVSQRKAEFLARQETSLLMSNFHKIRYQDAGLNKYKWSGVMDERERPDHKLLEDKIFTWDAPPITNLATGERNHPGEDFNCRCVAIPVID